MKNKRHSITPSFVSFLILALLFGGLSFPAAAVTPEVDPAEPLEFTTESGMRVLLLPRAGSGMVVTAVTVEAGSQDEPEGRAGLSHYLEHLLFDGLTIDGKTLDERGVTEAFENLAAYVNAFTRPQSTIYFVLTPKEEALAATRLLAAMLSKSTLTEEAFEKERKVILEELAREQALSSHQGDDSDPDLSALWSGTPFAENASGNEEEVKQATRDEAERYWRTRYVPSGMRVLIAGDLEIDGLRAVLAPLAELRAGDPLPERPDSLSWPGWGQWMESPSSQNADDGESGDEGGVLALALALPKEASAFSARVDLLARWLESEKSPLGRWASRVDARLAVAVSHQDPRAFMHINLSFVGEVPKTPEEMLSEILAAIGEARRGPDEHAARSLQDEMRAEKAVASQRLHYIAVLEGERMAATAGPLLDVLQPAPVAGSEISALAERCFADPAPRLRAIWAERGAPQDEPSSEVAKTAPWKALPKAAVFDEAPELPSRAGPFASEVGTFDNGLTLAVAHEAGSPTFGLHLLVADRALREKTAGAADLLHRLLGEKTALSDDDGLARRLARAGITLKTADVPGIPYDDYYNSPEYSYVRMEGPAGSLETAVVLLAEMIRTAEWSETSWKHAYDSWKKARGAAKRQGSSISDRLIGAEHPLTRSVAGSPDDPDLEPNDIRDLLGAWPDGYFDPSRLVLSIVSPLPAAHVRDIVSDTLGEGPPRAPRRGPWPPRSEKAAATDETPSEEAAQWSLQWGKIVTVAEEDRAALLVAVSSLSDRMVALIREKEGLSYSLGANVRSLPDGSWLIAAGVGTRPQNRARVEEIFEQILVRGAEDLPDAASLQRLHARARRSILMKRLSAQGRAFQLGLAVYRGPGSSVSVSLKDRAAVTPEAVQRAWKRYLASGTFEAAVTAR